MASSVMEGREGPTCWLSVTMKKNQNQSEDDANIEVVTKTLHFESVPTFKDKFDTSLTEYPLPTYSADDRFIIDLGTTESILLTVERSNPKVINDSSTDDTKWSNGHFWQELRTMIDFWQNFGRDPVSKKWTGGLRFHYEPPDYMKKMFPTIDKNVFIKGSININHKNVQKLSFQLSMVVGCMRPAVSTSNQYDVTFHTATSTGVALTHTAKYPSDALWVLPAPPTSWSMYRPNDIFRNWSLNAIESANEARYYIGDFVEPTHADWYARWTTPLADPIIMMLDSDISLPTSEEQEVDVPAGASRVLMYLVGGGGGGGNGGPGFGLSSPTKYSAGGGGGAGEVIITQRSVTDQEKLVCRLGRGGSGHRSTAANKSKYGDDGDDTWITIASKDDDDTSYDYEDMVKKYPGSTVVAHGGKGGEGGKNKIPTETTCPPSAGGALYQKGGNSATNWYTGAWMDSPFTRGEDGADPFGDGLYNGKGAYGDTHKGLLSLDLHAGGGGGAAADFRKSFIAGGLVYEFISKGGDGNAGSSADDGMFGGGGGGTATGDSGRGGHGFIALIFYK